MKKALKILNDLKIAKQVLILSHDTSSFSNEIERKKLEKINEAIEEIENIDSILKDLFCCIELTKDETEENKLNSMETYLKRLERDYK